MSLSLFITFTLIVVGAIIVLAYFVPGMVLRAIKDFKTRYQKDGGNHNE